jgi:hypothetical protein
MMSNETATETSAQDIATRVEAALFPSEEPPKADGDEVIEDAEFEELPEDDDPDSEGEDGGKDLEEIAEEEELTLGGYLGIDDDKLSVNEETGEFVFNTIIDGEEKQVPLKDVVASYQLQGHVNNKSMALETERQEFEGVRNKVAQELQQRVQGVTKLGELVEQELVSEFQSVDWDKLRVQDPANWTALRQEFAERAQKVMQVKNLVTEESQRLQKEQQQQFQAKAQEYFKAENEAMIADNPEWTDETVKTKALGEMKTFLANYGFSEQDVKGVTDHRLVRVIKDAMAFRNGTAKAEEKRLDGKELPKFQKPGSRAKNSASLVKARAAKAAKSKLKKSGSVSDAAALLVDRM